MSKRILAAIIAFALLLPAAGCASLLESERYTVSEFKDDEQGEQSAGSSGIKNYNGLKAAISTLVASYAESGELVFSSYEGEVSDDLSRACSEVRSETALGAYCVYYMSYDTPRRIVSYYETEIRIFYKKTKEQIDGIVRLTGTQSLAECIGDALSDMEPYLAVMTSSSAIDSETVRKYVEDAYYENPLGSLRLPEIEINVYPDGGTQRIFEVVLDYGYGEQELASMKADLRKSVYSLADKVGTDTDARRALGAARLLSEACLYEPDLRALSGTERDWASTAYGALCLDTADSLGFAMAYKALCLALDIECRVVTGRLNKEAHSWNIIYIDGEYYHVDTSLLSERGEAAVFLKNDAGMTDYWWDIEVYPVCEGTLTYESAFS